MLLHSRSKVRGLVQRRVGVSWAHLRCSCAAVSHARGVTRWLWSTALALLGAGGSACDLSFFDVHASSERLADAGHAPDAEVPLDAASHQFEDDAATTGDAGAEPSGPVMHASCSTPLPAELPQPPSVPTDAAGRPLFDLYRDLACGDVEAHPLCDPETVCPEEADMVCVRHGDSDTGICAHTVGDGGRQPFTMDDGRCVGFGLLSVHQRACCAEVKGMDCRVWPYDGHDSLSRKSKVGELCASHQDCERGLLCTALLQSSVCACPGSDKEPTTCGRR